MRALKLLFLIAVEATAVFSSPGGVLEKVARIQVDPTVVEQSGKIADPMAGNLVRFNLRAAVKDAHLEEGNSPIKAHFVLEKFTTEGAAKRLIGMESGRDINTVDGILVIQDASGKELASVKVHVHGSVAFGAGDHDDAQGSNATSDFEQRLVKEIEMLK